MKRLAFALMGALVLTGCGSVRYPRHMCLTFRPRLLRRRVPLALWVRSQFATFNVRSTSAKAASYIVPVQRRSTSTNTIVGR